jgi:hypothetical protein
MMILQALAQEETAFGGNWPLKNPSQLGDTANKMSLYYTLILFTVSSS